jgi:hypothetical protein
MNSAIGVGGATRLAGDPSPSKPALSDDARSADESNRRLSSRCGRRPSAFTRSSTRHGRPVERPHGYGGCQSSRGYEWGSANNADCNRMLRLPIRSRRSSLPQ